MAEPVSVVVLAAQRAGVENPLAAAHGVSHKCLVPIAGKPLIVHVFEALARVPEVSAVRVSVEPEAVDALEPLAARSGLPVSFVAARSSLADSVFEAAAGLVGPIVITTADNVLLSPDSIARLRALLGDGIEAVAALAKRAAVLAAHPEGQRNFYRFADDEYANCNLYGLGGARALKAAEIFREGGQFMKNPRRLVTAFGLLNIVLMRWRLLTLRGAMKRLSRRFGLRFEAMVLDDGAQAIDVDNERTYRVAAELLALRAAAAR